MIPQQRAPVAARRDAKANQVSNKSKAKRGQPLPASTTTTTTTAQTPECYLKTAKTKKSSPARRFIRRIFPKRKKNKKSVSERNLLVLSSQQEVHDEEIPTTVSVSAASDFTTFSEVSKTSRKNGISVFFNLIVTLEESCLTEKRLLLCPLLQLPPVQELVRPDDQGDDKNSVASNDDDDSSIPSEVSTVAR